MRKSCCVLLVVLIFFSCEKKTSKFPLISLQKQISIKNCTSDYNYKPIKNSRGLQIIFTHNNNQSKKGKIPFYLYFEKFVNLKSVSVQKANIQNAPDKFKLYLNGIYRGKYNTGSTINIVKKVKSLKILFTDNDKLVHGWHNDTIIALTKHGEKKHPTLKILLTINTKATTRIHVRRKRNIKVKYFDNKLLMQKYSQNKSLLSNGFFHKKKQNRNTKFKIYLSSKNTFVIYQLSEFKNNKEVISEILFTGEWQSKRLNENLFILLLKGRLSGYFANARQEYIRNKEQTVYGILTNNTLYFKKVLQTVYIDFPENALINMQEFIPAAKIKLAYATNQNFTKIKLYPCNKCYIRYKAAKALLNLQKELEQKKMSFVFYDCYRPYSIQKIMFNKFPIKGYVANPAGGSIHNRGLAVDINIIDKNGKELDMGTEFDDLSKKSNHSYTGFSDTILKNRLFLKKLMIKHGFSPIRSEWWHYNFQSKHLFQVINDEILCD